MKHLKKLSVVLMMTTLFSVSFTSCIDNEVSPVVEAIYEGQADLLAAQAAVQNAEAALLASEAILNEAYAAVQDANAAYTLAEVEGLEIANALAQQEVDEAQAELNLYLAELAFQLQEAGAVVALDYALKYKTYANAANDILEDKVDAQWDLAEAMAYANSNLPVYTKTMLENVVANAVYQVQIQEGKIAALQALIDDPNSLPSQISAWEERKAELEALIDSKEVEIAAKKEEAYNMIAGWDGQDDVRDNFIKLFDGYSDQADDTFVGDDNWAFQIAELQETIDNAQEVIDGYDAALADAETAVTDAQAAVDAAELALGMEDGAENAVVFDDYYEVDADGDVIAVGGVKYAAPANLQEELVNARIALLDATAAYNTYSSDLDDLTASYNEAATALEAAQTAFDGQTYAQDLADAQDDVSDAEAAFVIAEQAYEDAKLAFEADPTGSVFADGPDAHASSFLMGGYDAIDLGITGIHTDLAGDTYMRVDTWKETAIGSGEYVPASYYPTKYNTADLAVYISDIKADAVSADNVNITLDSDIWVWEATGAGAMEVNDGAGNLVNPDDHALTAGQASTADTDNLAVFVNVELDDTSVTKLYTFNVATNMLGKDDFSDRAFDIDAPTYASPNYLDVTVDDSATYDVSPNTDGEDDTLGLEGSDEFTAYANLWNAQLAEAVAQDKLDTGDDALIAAQEAFDYQKELFEEGVANLAALKSTMDTADEAATDAYEAVDNAWIALGAAIVGTPAAFDPAETLNEVLYNAELALATLESCDAECLQETIDAAQHEIDLIQPSLDFINAKIAEMQAQYDTYMETYVPGSSTNYDNLDADLKVAYDTLMHEAFLLNQELDTLDAEYDYVNSMLSEFSGSDNLSDISLKIELATLYDFSQGSYQDALEDLEDAEEELVEFMADMSNEAAYIEYLQALVDTLQARYENASALAAEYKALMDAALAS